MSTVLLARVDRLLGHGRVLVTAMGQGGDSTRCEARCDGHVVAVGAVVRVDGIDLCDPDSDARIVGLGLPN
jgi:hypothetical protein